MLIHPSSSTIHYCGIIFKAMGNPVRLASPWERPVNGRAVFIVQDFFSVFNLVTDTTPKLKSDAVFGAWKNVTAIVIGNHEIPKRTAMHTPVSVPRTTVACDISLKGPSKIKVLAVESTSNTVREGNRRIAFVVNTTDGPPRLKQGVFLSRELEFDDQVMQEPVESTQAGLGEVNNSFVSNKTTQD